MPVGLKFTVNFFSWSLVVQLQLHNWIWHARKSSAGWQLVAGPLGLGYANRKKLLMIQATEAVQRKMQAARRGATSGLSNFNRSKRS